MCNASACCLAATQLGPRRRGAVVGPVAVAAAPVRVHANDFARRIEQDRRTRIAARRIDVVGERVGRRRRHPGAGMRLLHLARGGGP